MDSHPAEIFYRRHKVYCSAFLRDCLAGSSIDGEAFPVLYGKAKEFAKALCDRRSIPDDDPFWGDCRPENRAVFFSQQIGESASFWATYESTKTIYRVTPELWEGLKNAKFPEAFPTVQLRVPRPAFIMDIPFLEEGGYAPVFVHLNSAEDEGNRLALRIATIPWFDDSYLHMTDWCNQVHKKGLVGGQGSEYPYPLLVQGVLSLLTQELGNSWDEYLKSRVFVEADDATAEAAKTHEDIIVRGVLNLLLYIQGDDDIVQLVHPGERPVKPRTSNPKKMAKRASQTLLEPHAQFEIGRRYAATIQQWLNEAEAGEGGARNGWTVRPHLRSAHSHLYWVGEGRQVPVVKFLPPIPVKGGAEIQPRQFNVQ